MDGRIDVECFSLSGGVDVVVPKKVPKRCASLLLWPEPILVTHVTSGHVIYIYLFVGAPIKKSWNRFGHLLFRQHKRIGKKYVFPIRTLPFLEPNIDKGSPSPPTTTPQPGTVENKISTDFVGRIILAH